MRALIRNADCTEFTDCTEFRKNAAAAMPRPNHPSIQYFRSSKIIYVPFLGNSLLDKSKQIFEQMAPDGRIASFVAMEDEYIVDRVDDGRFNSCWKIKFNSYVDFENGGFDGRIIMFSESMSSLLYFDHLDVSGIGCNIDLAQTILDTTLKEHLLTLRQNVMDYPQDERGYFSSIIDTAEGIMRSQMPVRDRE